MAETPGFPESPSRRNVVAAAGGVGLAAVLTACGSSGSSGSDSRSDATPTTGTESGDTTSDAGSAQPTDSAAPTTSDAGSGSSGGSLAKTSEIPVGGGKVFADQKVVVTQPTAGQFKGFSAVCTHQGCTVANVSGGTINCPCHGSKFHVADGSVANGPAQAPLASKQVRVAGGDISLA